MLTSRGLQIAFTFLILLTGGCALSPQTVDLVPQIETDPIGIGRGRTIELYANDLRTTRVMGNRGGLYSSSHVKTSDKLPASITHAAGDALRTWGFTVLTDDAGGGATTFAADAGYRSDNPPRMTVEIVSMQYETPKKSIGGVLNISMTIAIALEDDLRHYRGTYKSQSSTEFLFLPSEAKNNELVNAALSRALTKGFADRKLQNFLEQ